MNQSDCIFCKIIKGDIPSSKVYEDNDVYAFLDISQVTKGHTLVIPKQHTKNIYETPADVAEKLFQRIPKLSNAIKKAYNPIGLNILNNNGEAAGQSVFHLHIHLIPRYGEGDGFGAVWKTHNDDYSNQDLKQIASDISSNVSN
ncbi:HIT family protein [Aquibacillus sp. 3ASR75-11]|uniref:HIT family protein n=1 Tax=Terrihalobacillus insolitus TaxID=2950438 RepID=A0A9X4ANA3_9BACI|nr:HIT family protein [Terrihalobacillus insolitus]MDC3413758.1 HIT family protein [Terrihalobacillus insolitus]MDC3425619.1 HIT family protein [Terrihalobacillus insolitus]